jgi:hypothetical protein
MAEFARDYDSKVERHRMADRRCGQSPGSPNRARREMRRTRSPSRRAIIRKPSCLISFCGDGAKVGRHDLNGSMGGACTMAGIGGGKGDPKGSLPRTRPARVNRQPGAPEADRGSAQEEAEIVTPVGGTYLFPRVGVP